MVEVSALQLSDSAPKPKIFRSILGFIVTPVILTVTIKRLPAAFTLVSTPLIALYSWLQTHYSPAAAFAVFFVASALILVTSIRYRSQIATVAAYLGNIYWWVFRAALIATVGIIVIGGVVTAWGEPSIHAALVANNYEITTTLGFMAAAVLIGSFIGHGILCFFAIPLTIADITLACIDHMRAPDSNRGYSLLVGLAFISTLHLVHFLRENRHK